jgi:hypothetical protein
MDGLLSESSWQSPIEGMYYISPFGVVKLAIKWTPGPLFEERFLGREHESHRVVAP